MNNLVRLRLITTNARLVWARRVRNLTQANLSVLTGLSVSYISGIETLKFIPDIHAMDEISSALDMPVEYLFPQSLTEAVQEGVFSIKVAEIGEEQVITLTENRRTRPLELCHTDSVMQTTVCEIDRNILKDRIAGILHILTEQEQKIVVKRFGIEDGVCQTLETIGHDIGVSKCRVSQLETQALRKLWKYVRFRSLKEFLYIGC